MRKVYEAWVRMAILNRSETWDQISLNCNDSDAVTVSFSAVSVVPITETKHLQLHYYRDLSLKILRRSFAVGDSDGVAMWQATCCIKSITRFLIIGPRNLGWPRKTWFEFMKTDVSNFGLADVDSRDKDAWRAGIRYSLMLPTPQNGTWTLSWSKSQYGWMEWCEKYYGHEWILINIVARLWYPVGDIW